MYLECKNSSYLKSFAAQSVSGTVDFYWTYQESMVLTGLPRCTLSASPVEGIAPSALPPLAQARELSKVILRIGMLWVTTYWFINFKIQRTFKLMFVPFFQPGMEEERLGDIHINKQTSNMNCRMHCFLITLGYVLTIFLVWNTV